jgi:hypothetical protein
LIVYNYRYFRKAVNMMKTDDDVKELVVYVSIPGTYDLYAIEDIYDEAIAYLKASKAEPLTTTYSHIDGKAFLDKKDGRMEAKDSQDVAYELLSSWRARWPGTSFRFTLTQ